jgi:ATP synthase protein I
MSGNEPKRPSEDNAFWTIFGYMLSGLLIWGGIGWGLFI